MPDSHSNTPSQLAAYFAQHGLTPAQFDAATRPRDRPRGRVLGRSPAIVIRNVESIAAHFAADGLTVHDFLAAASRSPEIFGLRAETVVRNVEQVVAHFAKEGLTTDKYLLAAVKWSPQLFTRRPQSIIDNVEQTVAHFQGHGLTVPEYIAAVAKQPTILSLRPATVIRNIEMVVRRFTDDGMSLSDYLVAACKQPSLFAMPPTTIIGNLNLLLAIHEPNSDNRAALQRALRNPQLLSLAADNILLRGIEAVMQGAAPNIRDSKGRIEAKVAALLGHPDLSESVGKMPDPADPSEVGPHVRNLLLRALIRERLIDGQLREWSTDL